MLRRIGVVACLAGLLLAGCGTENGSNFSPSGSPVSTASTAQSASPAQPKSGASATSKQADASGRPQGLPAPDPITNDGSNSCAGQGLRANVAADAKPPYGIQQKAPRVRLDNGASLDASELQMNIQGTYLTVQVSARGSFMCGVYTKRNGVWKNNGPAPFQTLWLNGVQEVYATAYDPGLAVATDGE